MPCGSFCSGSAPPWQFSPCPAPWVISPNIVLIMAGYPHVWKSLSPFSGAINTFTFILIASVTVFFQHFQRLYRRMSANHAELETFSRDILNLNRDMETMVMERTMAEMALGVADGIRNPICVIGGFSRLLLKRLDPDDPTREWLTTIAGGNQAHGRDGDEVRIPGGKTGILFRPGRPQSGGGDHLDHAGPGV